MTNSKFDISSNYQNYFKNFLGAWSFPNGDETLTINGVDEREMFDSNTGGTKSGLCITFAEKDLPMVLNSTNAAMIAEVTGSEIPADWIGKKIIVGTGRVKAFGKVTDAIRVRADKPKTARHEKMATNAQIKAIQTLIDDGDINGPAMLEYYRAASLGTLTAEQASEILKHKTGEVVE